ncbi:MAG: cupin domain-containing protein [Phycisphaerales bacterium]|nr:cupin domain-containing protein [Phycisphaerales bacterium]
MESIAAHQPFPADGILTRTLHDDASLKVILFTFSSGQELSEHTASMPAVMHFLEGEADVGLGHEFCSVSPGAWIHMPAGLPHSVRTRSPLRMVLYLLKQPGDPPNRAQINA